MPRRIVIAILLIVMAIVTGSNLFYFKTIPFHFFLIPALLLISGALILKSHLAGHYIATPVLAYSIFRYANGAINNISHPNLYKSNGQALMYVLPTIVLLLFFSLSLILIVRDIIKLKLSSDYKLRVEKLNEPELWLYPWLLTLVAMYSIRFGFDLEDAIIVAILLPISFIFIHMFLKKSRFIAYENFRKPYRISIVSWLILYAVYLCILGYILLAIGAALAGL